MPSGHVPVTAATACPVPYLLDTAAAPGRRDPRHMECNVWLLSRRSCLVCRLRCRLRCAPASPRPSTLAACRVPAWSSVNSWLLRQRSGSVAALVHLPAAASVLHVYAPVRRGAVADARLGLAGCSIWNYFAVKILFGYGWKTFINGLNFMCACTCKYSPNAPEASCRGTANIGNRHSGPREIHAHSCPLIHCFSSRPGTMLTIPSRHWGHPDVSIDQEPEAG